MGHIVGKRDATQIINHSTQTSNLTYTQAWIDIFPAYCEVMMTMRPALIFDVNETLLDLEHLTPFFKAKFGDPAAMRAWFAQTILYSQAFSLTGDYVPFAKLSLSVLHMQAEIAGITLSHSDGDEFSALMAALPVHPDVKAALEKLQAEGFRLFTLTNNSTEVQSAQLERVGILTYFEQVYSVEEAGKAFKPAAQTYKHVENALGINGKALCLIACHTWDIVGARAAGWNAALILRAGNAPLSTGLQPNYICQDMHDFSLKIIEDYPLNR